VAVVLLLPLLCLNVSHWQLSLFPGSFGKRRQQNTPLTHFLMCHISPQKLKRQNIMHRTVYFWKDVFPLLRRLCREQRVSFNNVVNQAVQVFLSGCDVNELKLKAKLSFLLREEAELRRVCSAMLRSGSYLPAYVERTLREPGRSASLVRQGQVPLKALDQKEERAFRKIATRREEIAQEIADIQLRLLKDVKPFRLKPDVGRSQLRRRNAFSNRGGENT
jgi:hypothetical protein